MADLILKVDGMTCGGCASSVKKAVGMLIGVQEVEVELAAKRVCIAHDGSVDEELIRETIENAGFDIVE